MKLIANLKYQKDKAKINKQFSKKVVAASELILKQHKKLLLFPLMQVTSVIATFALLITASGFNETQEYDANGEVSAVIFETTGPAAWFFHWLLLTYIVNYIIGVALVFAIKRIAQGEEFSVRLCFVDVAGKFWRILQYAFFSAVVGLVIGIVNSILNEKLSIFGKILGFTMVVAYSVASVFLVPILIVQDIGPIEALKHSNETVKNVWGKLVRGNFRLTLKYSSIFIAGFGLFILGLVQRVRAIERMYPPDSSGEPTISFTKFLSELYTINSGWTQLMVLGAFITIAVLVMSSLISRIFNTNVYLFSQSKKTTQEFETELFKNAFSPKISLFK